MKCMCTHFLKDYFYVMCMGFLPSLKYIHHIETVPTEARKELKRDVDWQVSDLKYLKVVQFFFSFCFWNFLHPSTHFSNNSTLNTISTVSSLVSDLPPTNNCSKFSHLCDLCSFSLPRVMQFPFTQAVSQTWYNLGLVSCYRIPK